MMPPPRRSRPLPGGAVLALLVCLAGCFSPKIKDGTLACADGGVCPNGFVCRSAINLCYRDHGDAATGDAADGSTEVRDTAADQATSDARDAGAETGPPMGDGGLGVTCQTGSQCASGVCADGVCCQTPCAGLCEACNLSATPGVCTPVPFNDPSPPDHPSCAVQPQDSCGRDGTCDGARGCRLRPAGTTCGLPTCSGGVGTPAPTCNGQGVCQPSDPIPCAPYVCNGNTACHVSCSSSTQCLVPNSCVNNSCGPKPNGSSCAQSNECASQRCVDGVCCNEACTEKCKACDIGTSLGECTQVTSGQPRGARGACAGSGTCAGSCSAASATACTFPGDATTCRMASCAGTTFTARAGCDGAGSCPAAATSSCGDLVCNAGGTACLTTCSSDSHCTSAARPFCDGGACAATRSNGARCLAAAECASRNCVDGYCCNSACGLSCQACDIAGRLGICSPVPSGTPYGGRPACAGTGPCAGFCNGQFSGQCAYPNQATTCMCSLLAGTCNSAGACMTLAGVCL
jgi:hypothetical protein